ncbi:MAG: type 1 glutamine amidotransferase [Planctomycetes bacterium]|nr:type 1 glutamine amidotransferase [Planctomycetota bacterium]
MSTVIIEHSAVTGSDRLGVILRDHGHRLQVIRPDIGDPIPADLDGIDAIVSCGGPQSPVEKLEWIDAEMDLLRQAHEAALPVLGLCLGCELLARALGGTVDQLDGVEAGWHEVALLPAGREDPLFAGMPWWSTQLHWHRYHVAELPPGARVLAKSERTPVQAWSLGMRTYAIQFHPETYADTVAAWADDEPNTLKEIGLTADQLREQTRKQDPEATRLATRLFERVALLLMPLDRRYAGIAKGLHH